MTKRIAIFYLSTPGVGLPHALPGNVGWCYIRAEFVDKEQLDPTRGDDLTAALDLAKPRKGESVMSAHYVTTPR